MKYTVKEIQNANSIRDGEVIEAENLSEAKRKASRMQSFIGTVLEISDKGGALCYKEGGEWYEAW